MRRSILGGLSHMTMAVCSLVFVASPAAADYTNAIGKVVVTEGNPVLSCRRVFLQKSDGSIAVFRTPNESSDDAIQATAMIGLTTGLIVEIYYDPSVTTGCGTEPAISWISLLAPGASPP